MPVARKNSNKANNLNAVYVGKRADRLFSARIKREAVAALTRNAFCSPCGTRPRPTGRDKDLISPVIDPLRNKLLAKLPRSDFDLLAPHLLPEQPSQGTILTEANEEIDQIYFPLDGMISLVIVMNDGKAIETGTIGRDGMFGAAAGLGLYRSRVRSVVQIKMSSVRISAPQFRKAVAAGKELTQLCIEDGEVLLTQARITAACNALHTVEARFARWLLQTSAIIESDTITLTQEFLSEMLGVRRTSVTNVAGKLQSAGIIGYARGVIRIIDREALEDASCECFETLRTQRAL
jgi:CRP-like cAMP-binding protein